VPESQVDEVGKKRDRSPPFPFIGLSKSVERTAQLFAKAKRAEVCLADAASDWGTSSKSSMALQTIGALLAFGLIEASGSGENRKIKVSEPARRILEDSRPGIREHLLAEAALKPKLISEYAERWKDGRPDDHHSISQLKFDSHLTNEAASKFLRVFDETIRFARGEEGDILPDDGGKPRHVPPEKRSEPHSLRLPDKAPLRQDPLPKRLERKGVDLMEGERELTTGLLSKDASFRLIVSGTIGEKEIDRLIAKLTIDKEILAESTPSPSANLEADDE
jgi:hypothetical protein